MPLLLCCVDQTPHHTIFCLSCCCSLACLLWKCATSILLAVFGEGTSTTTAAVAPKHNNGPSLQQNGVCPAVEGSPRGSQQELCEKSNLVFEIIFSYVLCAVSSPWYSEVLGTYSSIYQLLPVLQQQYSSGSTAVAQVITSTHFNVHVLLVLLTDNLSQLSASQESCTCIGKSIER